MTPKKNVSSSPEPPRRPIVQSYGEVTITCPASGPLMPCGAGTAPAVTVGDMEAFCAEARRQGAHDATPIENVYGHQEEYGFLTGLAAIRMSRPIVQVDEPARPAYGPAEHKEYLEAMHDPLHGPIVAMYTKGQPWRNKENE